MTDRYTIDGVTEANYLRPRAADEEVLDGTQLAVSALTETINLLVEDRFDSAHVEISLTPTAAKEIGEKLIEMAGRY